MNLCLINEVEAEVEEGDRIREGDLEEVGPRLPTCQLGTALENRRWSFFHPSVAVEVREAMEIRVCWPFAFVNWFCLTDRSIIQTEATERPR